jgi:pepF/M3 family oligoendopeptidase
MALNQENRIGAPRWNLDSVYPSFDSPEYKKDLALLKEKISAFLALLEKALPSGGEELAPAIKALIGAWEEAGDIAENLSAYAEAVYTTDTRSGRALAEINAIDEVSLPLGKAAVLFGKRLAENRESILALTEKDPDLAAYRFFITESLEKAKFRMSPQEEDLARDLLRSGGDAWSRLHEAISSTIGAALPNEDGTPGEWKTVVALRDLARSPDRGLRERAYRAELSAWKGAEIPLAAALNGVKGQAIVLDSRRGWAGGNESRLPVEAMALRKSGFQSRLEPETLDTLIGTLESALPLYRRYLALKARLLGIERCAFYDLFAPVQAGTENAGSRIRNWEEATDFIAGCFSGFDPGMGDFARRAAAAAWIDGERREGKIGGAYCTGFPLAGECRVLCNFDGSFDAISTVAHELGHAWHHELMKDLPRGLSLYPMTLAETASIFAETLVFEKALADASDGERLPMIEENLKDSCQVIVDILSRFYFEKELFKGRSKAELSARELCDLMLDAQKRAYGEALNPEALHPYMWAAKGHYYSVGLGFYNYPYAFGQLFALGLYSRFRKEGPSFAAAYREILRATGRAPAEDVAAQAGFDIRKEEFWQGGLALITRRLEELERLAACPAAKIRPPRPR